MEKSSNLNKSRPCTILIAWQWNKSVPWVRPIQAYGIDQSASGTTSETSCFPSGSESPSDSLLLHFLQCSNVTRLEWWPDKGGVYSTVDVGTGRGTSGYHKTQKSPSLIEYVNNCFLDRLPIRTMECYHGHNYPRNSCFTQLSWKWRNWRHVVLHRLSDFWPSFVYAYLISQLFWECVSSSACIASPLYVVVCI